MCDASFVSTGGITCACLLLICGRCYATDKRLSNRSSDRMIVLKFPILPSSFLQRKPGSWSRSGSATSLGSVVIVALSMRYYSL